MAPGLVQGAYGWARRLAAAGLLPLKFKLVRTAHR